jgi:hypothetical protein
MIVGVVAVVNFARAADILSVIFTITIIHCLIHFLTYLAQHKQHFCLEWWAVVMLLKHS